jgi:hypothetical protein
VQPVATYYEQSPNEPEAERTAKKIRADIVYDKVNKRSAGSDPVLIDITVANPCTASYQVH